METLIPPSVQEEEEAVLDLDYQEAVGFELKLDDELVEKEEEEVTNLVDQLTGIQNQLQLQVISTFEAPTVTSGISKIARKVYKHPVIQSHFHIRGCTYFVKACQYQLAYQYQLKGLLIGIICSIGRITAENFEMSEEELGKHLNKLLVGHRFLLVIENMWNTRAWDDLKTYVPDNQHGSKILHILFTNCPPIGQSRIVEGGGGWTFAVDLHHFRAQQTGSSSIEEKQMVGFEDKAMTQQTGSSSIEEKQMVGFEDEAMTQQTGSSSIEEKQMVGFEDEAMKLVDRLTGLQKQQLEVISIVGMPGLGKTTLARTIYNHPIVAYHFHIRAWTRVSQAYLKRDLLLAILSSIVELTEKIYEMTDQKLLELLKRRLLAQRFLIVMDDMWDKAAWDDLQRSFPNDNNGSKILFTSRLAAQPNTHPFYLRPLTQSESWELLCQKVFQRKHCPQQLMAIGMQISEKCKGIPLAIVVIAGILANEKTLTRWTQVAKRVSSYIVSSPEQYMDTLALSYNHLPHHLKPCFLYLGASLEDREIPVQKLIWLWVAEGFICHGGSKRLEDVAEDYLMELINRSLLIVSKKGSTGGIKSCIMHDLIRELCLRKVKEENFMTQLFKYEGVSSPSSPLREKPGLLCIYSADFPHSSLMPFAPRARSLFCFAIDVLPDFTSFICQAFKLLRVLDLSHIKISLFPSEVVQLVELRYIALQVEVGSPPSLISNLQYLETLIVSSWSNVTLPKNTWKMVNLRHIYMKLRENETEHPSFEEVQGGDGYPYILENLQTLSFVCPSQSCEDVLARAPRLRKLGFCGPLISKSRNLRFPNLDSSHHLETLKLFNTAFYREASSSCNPIMFPERLKRLTLVNTALAWNEMWTLGMLPNLEVLKLKLHACVGRQWETSDGGFLRLKFLKLQDLDIVQWIASNNHFPCLRNLVLHGCLELEEIPSSLGDIPTLEMIEVRWCSKTAADSAREIKNDQEDKGNDLLKILIQESKGDYQLDSLTSQEQLSLKWS